VNIEQACHYHLMPNGSQLSFRDRVIPKEVSFDIRLASRPKILLYHFILLHFSLILSCLQG